MDLGISERIAPILEEMNALGANVQLLDGLISELGLAAPCIDNPTANFLPPL